MGIQGWIGSVDGWRQGLIRDRSGLVSAHDFGLNGAYICFVQRTLAAFAAAWTAGSGGWSQRGAELVRRSARWRIARDVRSVWVDLRSSGAGLGAAFLGSSEGLMPLGSGWKKVFSGVLSERWRRWFLGFWK